nr:hypothetical protein [uncultured Allomuricauda sp.]
MKNLKLITSMILLAVFTQIQAQGEPAGTLSTTTTSTFNYMKDGAKMPYTVKVQESRAYSAKFDAEDIGKTDQDRVSSPAKVAKLITITSLVNPSENTQISLKYDKQVTDTFELVATDRGFAVKVDDKSMEYIMGKGVYFAKTADKDFFIVDEFDMVK